MKRLAQALVLVVMFALPGVTAQADPPPGATGPIIAHELTALAWDGKEFIASYGENKSALLNVSLAGQRVIPFARNFSATKEAYVAISQGDAGFPKGYVYVSADLSIFEFTPTGSSWRVFSSPPGASRISYLAFDTVGTWGHLLFALDDNGLLWSINADGTAKVLENFSNFGQGQALKPEGIVVAPQSFGAFGGQLIITLQAATRVLAIPPNDTSKVVTIAQLPGEEPESVLAIPPNSDLYVAAWVNGTAYRMPAADLLRYVGSLIVVTEGELEPFSSFTILQATGDNVTKTRIATVSGSPHLEGASFVPSSLDSTTLIGTAINNPTPAVPNIEVTATVIGLMLGLAAVVILATILKLKRGRSSIGENGR
ncbi:MAG: hypothetical protein OK455_06690 [Thaumarchaeota archaeon]|nr:hypothetical protein [Nitrososphaerota archaeon]